MAGRVTGRSLNARRVPVLESVRSVSARWDAMERINVWQDYGRLYRLYGGKPDCRFYTKAWVLLAVLAWGGGLRAAGIQPFENVLRGIGRPTQSQMISTRVEGIRNLRLHAMALNDICNNILRYRKNTL